LKRNISYTHEKRFPQEKTIMSRFLLMAIVLLTVVHSITSITQGGPHGKKDERNLIRSRYSIDDKLERILVKKRVSHLLDRSTR